MRRNRLFSLTSFIRNERILLSFISLIFFPLFHSQSKNLNRVALKIKKSRIQYDIEDRGENMVNRVQPAKFGYPHKCILIAKDSIIRHRANTSECNNWVRNSFRALRSADQCPRAVIYCKRDSVRISCRAPWNWFVSARKGKGEQKKKKRKRRKATRRKRAECSAFERRRVR